MINATVKTAAHKELRIVEFNRADIDELLMRQAETFMRDKPEYKSSKTEITAVRVCDDKYGSKHVTVIVDKGDK